MSENQKILFILAITFVIGFFAPLITMTTFMPMPSLFGEESQNSISMSMSVFDMLTNKNSFDVNLLSDPQGILIITFFISLIAVPVLTVMIALTQKYEWLFTISTAFIIFSLSMIYSMNTHFQDNGEMTKLGWAWGCFFIPSLIMLVMGLIALLKKNQSTTA